MESFDKIQYTVLLRKEFYYPQYKHDDWTVYIPVYGSFHCTFNGKTDRILPGEVYVIPPDVPFDRGVDQPLSVQFIRFRENEASPWPFPIPTGKLQFRSPDRCEETLRMLREAAELPPTQQEAVVRHCLKDLLLQAGSVSELPPKTEPQKRDETLAAATEYLKSNFSKKISLSDLAKKIGISPSGLIKKFRKQLGITPQRYLSELRLQRAKDLLTNTALSVSQISEDTGFESVYYFSKFFKKETGDSPSEYRKKYLL